jgi:hypothetical protein
MSDCVFTVRCGLLSAGFFLLTLLYQGVASASQNSLGRTVIVGGGEVHVCDWLGRDDQPSRRSCRLAGELSGLRSFQVALNKLARSRTRRQWNRDYRQFEKARRFFRAKTIPRTSMRLTAALVDRETSPDGAVGECGNLHPCGSPRHSHELHIWRNPPRLDPKRDCLRENCAVYVPAKVASSCLRRLH